jgi:hypothetical protein
LEKVQFLVCVLLNLNITILSFYGLLTSFGV